MFSIVTFNIMFILSVICIVCPISFTINLPCFRRTRISIDFCFVPIAVIGRLWLSLSIWPIQIYNLNGIDKGDGVKSRKILLLFITLAYLSITLEITDVLQAAAFWVNNRIGFHYWKLLYYVYVMLVLFSISQEDDLVILSVTALLICYQRPTNLPCLWKTMSGSNNHKHPPHSDYEVIFDWCIIALDNGPVILSGTILIIQYTQTGGGLEATAFIAEFVTISNTSSVVTNPSVKDPINVVPSVCSGFHITNTTLTTIVVLPFVASTAGCYIAISIYFRMRDNNRLPRNSPIGAQAVLRQPHFRGACGNNDRIGTWVGGILTGTSLIVIVIVKSSESQFNIWSISLPFALAKLIFDCVRDLKPGKLNTSSEYSEDELSSDLHATCNVKGACVNSNLNASAGVFRSEYHAPGAYMFSNSHGLIINGGTFVNVGRDAHISDTQFGAP